MQKEAKSLCHYSARVVAGEVRGSAVLRITLGSWGLLKKLELCGDDTDR